MVPFSEISNIKDDDVNILKEAILKFILKYFFINIKKEEEKEAEIISKLKKMTKNIMKIFNDIDKFSKNKQNPETLKFRLYRATLYNIYSVTKGRLDNDLFGLSILAQYKQKIIDINKSSINNPYRKAVMFLKEVAEKLNEKSCLFDLLMQYNSGISDDITLLGAKHENTKYELSLFTVEEITKHLIDILPDFIVRYTGNDELYAFYSSYNDIIFINEKETFDTDIIRELDNKSKYILPIVILLVHECWGHMKIIKSNKIKRKSPFRNFFLRKENFDEDIMEIINNNTGKAKGESGLQLEKLIIGQDYKDLSKFLLSIYVSSNQNLLNSELWVKSNFNSFQTLLKKNIKNISKSLNIALNEPSLNKNRDINEDKFFSKYALTTYFEDDIEIGPLRIV